MSGRSVMAWLRTALVAVALLGALGISWAQADELSTSEENASQGSLIETFMTGFDRTMGVAVATSQVGSGTTERYFGLADGAAGEPVVAQTAFEWGRCSDLIVWACVMQLVEQGLLDLDDAVSDHLPDGVSLPAGYQSIDVVDLMNHTAGLDVAMNGAASSLPDGTTSAQAALSLFSVKEEFPPGTIVGYTPYDAVLAAVVVEQISGQDFADYVTENVLERLGMEGTYFMVGGSASRLAASVEAPSQTLTLAVGSNGPVSISSPRASTGSAFVCFGPVGDLLTLANGVMGLPGVPSLFEDEATAEQLFSVSRTYPSLGVARIAHGLFAFPFVNDVFGMSGTTTSGFSSSVYMNRETGLAIAVLVDESGRADLTQGIPRVLVGRSDVVVANASSPANNIWVGTYQDAGRPNHGPAKVLTALERMWVSTNDQGVLTFDGHTATSLGAGVYSIDTAIDQDVYRFHVSLERGAEFSRVTTDSYEVPLAMLTVEYILLGAAVLAGVICILYALAGLGAWIKARVRRIRFNGQPAVLGLAVATLAAGVAAAFAAFQIVEGLPPAALDMLLGFEAVYLVVAGLLGVWLAVTRWRGSGWTTRQNIACVMVGAAALAIVMNLVYWEMLP